MGKPIIERFVVGPLFIPMLFPVIMVAFVFFKMMDIILPLLEIVPKAIQVCLSIFNPPVFINDLIFGITFSIKSLFDGITSSISSGTTPKKSKIDVSSQPSVCIPPTFMNLLFLLICPPLALFLDRGMSGIFHVVICAILTMKMYYFPGLIYAALHILC